MKDLAAPPVSPVVWEAALGRRVVLIEDRLWVNAREKARAMLGGEPEYVQSMGGDPPYIGILPPVDLWAIPWVPRLY